MQRLWALPVVLLLGAVAPSSAVRLQLSPVTRVVSLLEGLSESIEKEGKKEEELYESFVCWAKSIVSQKTESNSAAESRIDMLATYLADLAAGRIELTSERKDLEKEISTLTGEIESSTALRNKEKEDFEEAEAEMKQAVKALNDGIEVLKTATEGHEQGVLLRLKGAVSAGEGEGFAARTREAASLNRAVQLGRKVLSKGDSVFLSRLLTGEVPNVDWKKLNRKATFKSSYKARSGKIQETLAKLLEEFTSNLQEATKKETSAQALFDKLMGTKGDQKSAAQDALERMDSENGAKGMSKMESQEEHDKLQEQVKDDTAYVKQVEASLAEKKEEWKDRQTLRTAELAAISKAVSILRSDDARDTFKKSFKSQNKGAFLQVKEGSMSMSQRGAFEALKQAAASSNDARLAALALTLRSGSHFDEVLGAIDKMVGVLKAEEAEDLSKKEDCEADNAENTRKAVTASRSIDEMSDAITVLKGEIKDLKSEIEDKNGRVKEIDTELVDAKKVRDDEHAEYKVSKQEDKEAKELVKSAAAVLTGFYKENDLALVQHAKKQPGSAPMPPPPTWEAPYGGKTGESQGIVAILGMVEDDIAKDIAKADSEEKESLDMYTETKAALTAEKENLNGQITEMTSTMSGKEIDVSDTKGERSTKKGELDSVLQSIADAKSYCEFFTVNYPLRLKNRQIEIDGLNKAKTILKGGAFTAPADPDREMKPGDALLQRKRSGH